MKTPIFLFNLIAAGIKTPQNQKSKVKGSNAQSFKSRRRHLSLHFF
jgi:hypothetical protein